MPRPDQHTGRRDHRELLASAMAYLDRDAERWLTYSDQSPAAAFSRILMGATGYRPKAKAAKPTSTRAAPDPDAHARFLDGLRSGLGLAEPKPPPRTDIYRPKRG
jgi:hypothetical protein